jgi:Multicopper oxidase
VHWHGLILPEEIDGHPRFAIEPGQTYVYEFEVINRAGINWFHPHPDRLTGQQAYAGLAGLFIVTDPLNYLQGLMRCRSFSKIVPWIATINSSIWVVKSVPPEIAAWVVLVG